MKFICPLCKSPLSKEHYHRVLKIQQNEEKLQKGELEKMRSQVVSAKNQAVAAKKREGEIKLKAKEDEAKARQQATIAERKRSERLLQGHSAKMKKMQERIKMLESGTTPQVIGLADEGVLVKRLKTEFPTDRIVHAGKGGDVLHALKGSTHNIGPGLLS